MTHTAKAECRSHGWLDSLAVSMSVVCAIHCLITPILIVSLPILATTFWANKDFHLWMILLVLPTSAIAVFLGCQKHKDKWVFALCTFGLTTLLITAIYEAAFTQGLVSGDHAHCVHCAQAASGNLFTTVTVTNILGGLMLASAHIRNYLLCRKVDCSHG